MLERFGIPRDFREMPQQRRESVSFGSGFILKNNYILTNFHVVEDATEVDVDVISDGDDSVVGAIMEHIEQAGIHSGDSACVIPPFSLSEKIKAEISDAAKALAKKLEVHGLMNIQFAVKDEELFVIEVNPRASRTVPFIAKAYDEPYVNYAAKVMLGEKKVKDFNFTPRKKGYAIKIPVFSYGKFPDVKKELGPEMKSTGEAIRFIENLKDPFFRKVYSERNMHLSR